MTWCARRTSFDGAQIILAEDFGGNTVRFTFDRPIADLPLAPLGLCLLINGINPIAFAFDGPDFVQLTFGAAVGAGDPWVLTCQPAWLVTPVALPQSGVVV